MRILIITSYVIGIILIVYIILCVFIGLVVNTIAKNIKQKEHAINVLTAQKYDLLVALGNYMEENDVHLPDEFKDALNINGYDELKTINTIQRLNIKTVLFNIVSTMFYIAESNGLGNNQRYITLNHSILEIDEQHRKNITIYNSQVLAYNYWIQFFIFKPIAYIFRLKKKETMF